MARERWRLAVFVSGSGSNLQALLDASRSPDYPATVAVVVSNAPAAPGLQRAVDAGVPTEVVPHTAYRRREDHERAILERLELHRPLDLVVLAGYLRLLGPTLLEAFERPVLLHPGVVNIHPADTRAYQGTHGYEFALGLLPGSRRLEQTAITVHFVDRGMDTGPIITQRPVPVLPDDTLDSLRARGLQLEHALYPEVVRWIAEGRVRLIDGQVVTDERGA